MKKSHDDKHDFPPIETMIVRVDRNFTDLKKDIVMSVVNEEAKRIVAEATEAGVNAAGAPDENDTSDLVDAMSVSEALDVAEAGLAATVAADSSVPAEIATPPASVTPAPPTPA